MIGYKKVRKFNLEKMASQYAVNDASYKPFDLAGVQAYNPIYSRFFNMSTENYNSVSLNQMYQICDLNTLHDDSGKKIKKDVFVKFSPLLDPLKFIMGKYDLNNPLTTALPGLDPNCCSEKIGNVNNCSYTDAFFSYLSNMMLENHGWVHGISFYGSALAIQNRFRFNLADDYDFVKDSDFFANNIGKYHTLDKNAIIAMNELSGSGSRSNRHKIIIVDDLNENLLDESVELSSSYKDADDSSAQMQLEYEKLDDGVKIESESDSSSSDSDSTEEAEDEEDEEEEEDEEDKDEDEDKDKDENSDWETESDESYTNEEPMYCYLHDFPVQMIFQERCNGTLDELLMQNIITPQELLAALFQIVIMLLTYQKTFDLTHNDLHTNNIMFVTTNEPFLHYKFENVYYKVPTYGRIYKLIDFGRAIYRFQDKEFCSDSFAPSGDAHSQYNCEPFMNMNKPRLDPNFSFDLCRLGCSMYDFVVDDEINAACLDMPASKHVDDLIRKWCSDDEDKNVVYKKNGQERYSNFKLYKMIARTVHAHTPKSQLSNPAFAEFKYFGIPASFMNIDDMPKYKNKE